MSQSLILFFYDRSYFSEIRFNAQRLATGADGTADVFEPAAGNHRED